MRECGTDDGGCCQLSDIKKLNAAEVAELLDAPA
jgi:hypothetical protein